MNNRRYWQIINWLLVAGLVLGMFFISIPLWAQECRGHSCNDAGVDTNLSTSISGDRLIAVGAGDFGVDIAQCLATKSDSWGFGLFGRQRLQQNLHCMGLAYMQAGMVDAARHVLCDVEDAPLKDMPNCPGTLIQAEPAKDDHAEQIMDMQAQIETLVARPRIVREPFLTDDKRRALMEVRDE